MFAVVTFFEMTARVVFVSVPSVLAAAPLLGYCCRLLSLNFSRRGTYPKKRQHNDVVASKRQARKRPKRSKGSSQRVCMCKEMFTSRLTFLEFGKERRGNMPKISSQQVVGSEGKAGKLESLKSRSNAENDIIWSWFL